MDRRTAVALVLMALVIVVTPRLFPSRQVVPSGAIAADSGKTIAASPAATVTDSLARPSQTRAPVLAAAPAASPASAKPTPEAPPPVITVDDSVQLTESKSQVTIVSPGGVPAAVRLDDYRNLRPGKHGPMVVTTQRGPLLHYRIARARDAIALDTVRFAMQHDGSTTTLTSASPAITITYKSTPDGYRTAVHGTVGDAPQGSTLLVDLPRDFQPSEADTLDDMRHLAYAYKIPLRDVTSVMFSKLDTTVRVDTNSYQWVSARSKYWIVALMKPTGSGSGPAFHSLAMRADTAVGRIHRHGAATTTQALSNGQFAFDLYVGPQSWQELHALGNDLESVNQYAGFFHPIVQPFATIVMRVLLWMRANLKLSYGWVLVLFGISIRMLMWPLNQKAMRTSMQMQRLQPELTAVQAKYKSEPDKQREALVKLYAEHGMSPLSPVLGCLPMMLPMPILWALYFVFQNTIEFRGVQFLWLPDISLRDPYYITPIVMGVSMFVLSWIGMRSVPPNPQTKMMSYMMPVMFTVMFLNLASGLNLYYAVQNIAALPQQWIVSRERAKANAKAPSVKITTGSGAGGGGSGKRTG
jgi:YidC/Oxa1 family membrane protein insertase